MKEAEKLRKEVRQILNEWGYLDVGGVTHLLQPKKSTHNLVNIDSIIDIRSLMQTMYRLGQKDKISEIKDILNIEE